MTADIIQIRDYESKSFASTWNSEPADVIVITAVPRSSPGRRARRWPNLLTLKQKIEALRELQAIERGD